MFWRGGGGRWKTDYICDSFHYKEIIRASTITAILISHAEHASTSHYDAHHEVSRQEFLEELGLFVLNSLDDELVVAGHVEERPAGSGVRQLDQRLVAQRIL